MVTTKSWWIVATWCHTQFAAAMVPVASLLPLPWEEMLLHHLQQELFFKSISHMFFGWIHTSIHWFKGQITGKSHISWEHLWFPVKIFPLNTCLIWFLMEKYVQSLETLRTQLFFDPKICQDSLAMPKQTRTKVGVPPSLLLPAVVNSHDCCLNVFRYIPWL